MKRLTNRKLAFILIPLIVLIGIVGVTRTRREQPHPVQGSTPASIRVNSQDSALTTQRVLLNSAPFLILLMVWIVLMARKLRTGGWQWPGSR